MRSEALCPQSLYPPLASGGRTTWELSADEMEMHANQFIHFNGNVLLTKDDMQWRADTVHFDVPTKQLDLRGEITYHSTAIIVIADTATHNIKEKKSVLHNASFTMPQHNVRGSMAKVAIDSAQKIKMEQVKYTTCPVDNETWSVSSKKLIIESGQGKFYGNRFTVGGIPILYLPYISLPVDGKRHSGLLPPTYRHSSLSGNILRLPVYVNIAPQFDLTLIPAYFEKRGVGLASEIRWLMRQGEGSVNFFQLPDDRIAQRDRWHMQWRGRWAHNHWLAAVHYDKISDPAYINDLDSDAFDRYAPFLRQNMDIQWGKGGAKVHVLVHSDQALVSSATRGYRTVPQMNAEYSTRRQPFHLAADILTQYTAFSHPTTEIDGDRFYTQMGVHYPMRWRGGFLTPSLRWKHITHRLDHSATISTDAPSLIIDGGFFMHARHRSSRGVWHHAIEPRVFYIRTPHRTQDNAVPLIDTDLLRVDPFALFRANVFAGYDRISDDHRLSLGIVGRLWRNHHYGKQIVWRLGQIFYLDERRVLLPNEQPNRNDRSPLLAQVDYSFSPIWRARAQYHSSQNNQEFIGMEIHYWASATRRVNIAYRSIHNSIVAADPSDQILWAGIWRINPRWQIAVRGQYDWDHDRTLAQQIGLAYNSCCWKIQFAYERKLLSGNRADQSFGVRFQLWGAATRTDVVDDRDDFSLNSYANH